VESADNSKIVISRRASGALTSCIVLSGKPHLLVSDVAILFHEDGCSRAATECTLEGTTESVNEIPYDSWPTPTTGQNVLDSDHTVL